MAVQQAPTAPMTMLDVFAIVVLVTLAVTAVLVIVLLGSLPGKIARKRQHPYVQAVTVAGWVGLIFVVAWPLALIWAYVDIPRAAPAAGRDERNRVLSRDHAERQMQEAAE
jgi:amino acid transporter